MELPEEASVATYVVKKSPGGAWTIANTVTENTINSSGRRSKRLRMNLVTL